MCRITENIAEDLRCSIWHVKEQMYDWYKKFKDRREVVVHFPRFDRHSTCTNDSNIEKRKKRLVL